MQQNDEPCGGHKQLEIPFRTYTWDKLTDLIKPEVTPLYCGCTEGCRKFMIEQYKSLITIAKLGIKYYKYQIIPKTMKDDDHLSIAEFMAYCLCDDQPEDELIESHLNHVIREDKFVPKEEDEDSEEEESSDNNNEKQDNK